MHPSALERGRQARSPPSHPPRPSSTPVVSRSRRCARRSSSTPFLPPEHADQGVLADAVHRVHDDPRRLVDGEPPGAARQNGQRNVDRRPRRSACARSRPAPPGRTGVAERGLHAPRERDPLFDRALDPRARQPGNPLVQELIEPLAAIALARRRRRSAARSPEAASAARAGSRDSPPASRARRARRARPTRRRDRRRSRPRLVASVTTKAWKRSRRSG